MRDIPFSDSEAENLGLMDYNEEIGDTAGEDVDDYNGEDIDYDFNAEDIDNYDGENVEDAGEGDWEAYPEESEMAEARRRSYYYRRRRQARLRRLAMMRRRARLRRLAMRRRRIRLGRLARMRRLAWMRRQAQMRQRYPRTPYPIYSQPINVPRPSMEPIDYPQGPMEPMDYPQEPMEPMDYPPEPMEPGDMPPTSMEPAYVDIGPGELDALEMAEDEEYLPEDYMPEDYMLESFSEYEPEIFDDTAELAEALREALNEDYEDATPEEMEEILESILGTMTPAAEFNFKKVLGSVLPVAGGIVGTVIGGPAGTALGSGLGKIAAGAIASKPKRRPKRKRVQTRVVSTVKKGPTPAAKGGSAAAAQLLQLTQNPNMLKGLLSLALGSQGKKSITIGKNGPNVSVGGLVSMLNTLAGKALKDADELVRESEEAPEYLRDDEGNLIVDAADPEARANELYDVLLEAEDEQLFIEGAEARPWSKYFPFSKGDKLLVEYQIIGPDPDIGSGVVLARTSSLLRFKIHIDKWDMFNVPETDAKIEIKYRKEGSGNRAKVVVNDQTFIDNDVTIRSRGNTREISMSIKILGQKIKRITLTKSDSDEAKLKFKAAGEEHVLVLTKR